ncbi:MAG: glycosyltransferase family 4 protein [Chloroflexota bacterium]
MKIGLIIYGSLDTLSGGYLYDRKLVEYLREQGDTVDVISLPWRNYAAHLADNMHFHLPRGFDLLIQDELNHPSLLSANSRPRRYPVISLVHHLRCSELRPKWQNDVYRLIEKKYLKSVDGFIFNSQTTKGVVSSFVESSRPDVVAYPPTDRFGEPISESEIIERAKGEELRILFLGNVIYRKGLHTLLEAIAIGDQRLAVSLDVVGSLASEPDYAGRMQKFVSANGLSLLVTFHSSLEQGPLQQKLRDAHVLVLPSSYEGYGIVYLEGMCFGLPAIGTTAGAAREIIRDGVDGFLIEPGDSNSLANRLRVLKEKRDVLVHMSLAARERYLRQPKWSQTAGEIRRFLLSFLK